MLFPVAGSRLYIAAGANASAVSGWIEVGSAESFGSAGVEWDMVDATSHLSTNAEVIKGLMRLRPMQIVMALDPDDAGQLLLWEASRSRDEYAFQLRFPIQGGVQPIRQWCALVIALDEVFDAANSLIKLLATLQPNGEIERI